MTHRVAQSTATAPVRGAAAAPAPGDDDPRWWVFPLAATVLAPLLSFWVAGGAELFSALPVFLVGGFVVPFAFVVPAWCLARTQRRRQARVSLAVLACGLAVVYPALIDAIGWMVFFVLLLTGNVHV
ncbi:hypothetical protein ABT034_21045 [Streptomyces sp. NPDC002773]|uniref:hypothetical protein n=1 Tax=Streptomyces sp. NPDC002773 TaxID=3154430 RepID=UPI00331F00A6